MKDRARCQVCGTPPEVEGPTGRRDVCDRCGADLHACRQCTFFDLHTADQCREPEAERVEHKESGNFCEFFKLSSLEGSAGLHGESVNQARDALEALFKK